MSLQTKFMGLGASLRFDNWPQLLVDRLFFRKSRFVPHRLNGVDLVVDQKGGDECGIRPCLVEGMYDPFLEAAGAFNSARPLNIADLGANAGGFSLIFATRGIPIRKIVAVEMNPLTYSRMRLNVLTAYGPRAKTINAAISAESGALDVPFNFGSTGESVTNSYGVKDGTFRIRAITFDEFYEEEFKGETVDIAKVDIEGAEWSMVDAGTCQHLRSCRFIIVEVHPDKGRDITQFEAALRPFGFKLLEVRNEREPDVFCFAQG
jgi:FkbM family methyltransferase